MLFGKKSLAGGGKLMESLENRRLLSATLATTTSIQVAPTTSTLGNQVFVEVKVKSKAGPPGHGDVEILDNGTVVGEGVVDKHGIVEGGVNCLSNGTGGTAFAAGTNLFRAKYLGNGKFAASKSSFATLKISMPKMTTEKDGLGIATVQAGSGKAVAAGKSVTVAYTGYLTNGTMFDSSTIEADNGNTPGTLTFNLTSKIWSAEVVAGFDEGVIGMKVGAIRVLDIPSALAYGSAGKGSIPPNAALIFVVDLVSSK
jgi:FKBP-type peptidyl-prolyl cis-trans isomerase